MGTDSKNGSYNVILGATDLHKSGDQQLVIGAGTSNWINGDNKYYVGLGTATPKHKLDVEGDIEFTAVNSSTPTGAKDVTFEYVNDTTLKIKMKGTDGVVRSTTLTLS